MKKNCKIIVLFGLTIVFLFLLTVHILNSQQGSKANKNRVDWLMTTDSLQFAWAKGLNFQTYHVQGLEVVGDYYFITSVEKEEKRGWLFRINRSDLSLDAKLEMTDNGRYHPGGLQFDGKYLWIPVAEYKRNSSTKVIAFDPFQMKAVRSFAVRDHIGAIASDGNNRLFGANWDARKFYVWDKNGNEISRISSPTNFAYQDIKFLQGLLLCNGYNGDSSAVDVIDVANWQLARRFSLPRDRWVRNMSKEGMAVDNGNFYFLPEDGPNSEIFCFKAVR